MSAVPIVVIALCIVLTILGFFLIQDRKRLS